MIDISCYYNKEDRRNEGVNDHEIDVVDKMMD